LEKHRRARIDWGRRGLGTSLTFAFAVMVVLSGCSSPAKGPKAKSPEPTEATSSTPTRASPKPTPTIPGPLDDLRWTGGPVPVNRLLFDSGRALISVGLDGDRHLIWHHPEIHPVALAATPDGSDIAMVVALSPRTARDPSFALYWLHSGGAIQKVDVVTQFAFIDTPLFLRNPSDPAQEPRLYWVTGNENIDPITGRVNTKVMVYDESGPRQVRVTLRFGEGVLAIFGYPGASTFAFSLFDQSDSPTRLEILKNIDYTEATRASVSEWGSNVFRARTDSPVGVAWTSPTDYVIPVVQRFHRNGYSLRLFRNNCEIYGSHVVYRGHAIDLGSGDVPWPLLGAGTKGVLVLGAKDATSIAQGQRQTAPWRLVNTLTGQISKPGARWSPGPWAWVAPSIPSNPRTSGGCQSLKWTWP